MPNNIQLPDNEIFEGQFKDIALNLLEYKIPNNSPTEYMGIDLDQIEPLKGKQRKKICKK